MNNELNKIDALYCALSRNVDERHQYSIILSNMEDVIKENVWVYFKMFIKHRTYGYSEVKDNEQNYEIPHELNEQIYHLVHNYYFKKMRELEEERDKIFKRYTENNNEIQKSR